MVLVLSQMCDHALYLVGPNNMVQCGNGPVEYFIVTE